MVEVSLNIKNEHVHDLVRQAAERTGSSQTSVVEQALTLLLRRLDADDEERARRIEEIVAAMHAEMRVPGPPLLTDDDLYDENGLYR